MKSNLILFDMDNSGLSTYSDYYSALQKIFNLSTVEFVNTTVFSDFIESKQNLGKYLGNFTVVAVGNMGKIELDNLCNIISNRYATQCKEHNNIKYWVSQSGICVLIKDIVNFKADWDTQFFEQTLRLPTRCTFMQLFGLNKDEVKKLFFEIPNASNFDISVYTQDKISQVSVASKQTLPQQYMDEFLRNVHLQFHNHWFADTEQDILEKLVEILSIRNIRICVVDSLTKGVFQSYLCKNDVLVEEYINQIFTITQDFDYQFQLGISEEFLDTHPKNGVDMAYEMSAVMMERDMADIVISLCGDRENCFISIGDSQAIHVYKYTDIINLNVLCNQAIFKILKKLKENQLYFFENSV